MLLYDFMYWKGKDIFKYLEDKKSGNLKIHLYGIEGYFGLPGHGKTMCLVYRAEQYRKK